MSQSLNHVHRSGGVDDGQHEFEREDAGVSDGVGVASHAGDWTAKAARLQALSLQNNFLGGTSCRKLAALLTARPVRSHSHSPAFFSGPENFGVSDVSRKFGPEKRGEGGRERERKREEKERGEGKRREERERESERLHARVRSHQVIDRLWTCSILSSGLPCLTIRPHKHGRLSKRQGSVLTVFYTTLGITLVSLCCLPHPLPHTTHWRQ